MRTFYRLVGILAFSIAASATDVEALDISFPKPIQSELPMYPEIARKAHVAATVRLWFVLDENGDVTQAGIISGHPLLDAAAVKIAKSWRFDMSSMLRPNARYETKFIYVLDTQLREGSPKLIVSMNDFRRVEIVSELYIESIE